MCKPILIIETFPNLSLIALTPVINKIKMDRDVMYADNYTDAKMIVELFNKNPFSCLFAFKARMYAHTNEVAQ